MDLRKRILDIAFKHRISHLGSSLTSVGIIDDIYSKMNKNDIFILSSGHAALALYAVLEKYKGLNAEELYKEHGTHPHLDQEKFIYCSTGSLGMGLTVAIGRALANKEITVYCLVSDGECAEGSIWEGLRFSHERNLSNLKIFVNANGYCAYDAVDTNYLAKRIAAFNPSVQMVYTDVNQFSFLRGLNAHYHVMTREDYESAIKEIENA